MKMCKELGVLNKERKSGEKKCGLIGDENLGVHQQMWHRVAGVHVLVSHVLLAVWLVVSYNSAELNCTGFPQDSVTVGNHSHKPTIANLSLSRGWIA